eukprot:9469028-Pyramimonas_sp.AAC.1
MDGWSGIWNARPASEVHTRGPVQGAAAGPDGYVVRHLADFPDTAQLFEDIRRLPRASLPVPKIGQLRAAAKSFKWHAGQGADRLAPRSLSRFTDETLSLLVCVLWLAEHWGRWPTQLAAVHI